MESQPVWLCPLSEIPDIYWAILIQSVKSLMFSMCHPVKPRGVGRHVSKCFTGRVSLPQKRLLRSLFTFGSENKQHYIFGGPRTLPWQFGEHKNSPYWRLRGDFGLVLNPRCSDKNCVHVFMRLQPFLTLLSPPPKFFFSPKSGTIKSALVIGCVVRAKLGSRSLHGPGCSVARADNSCLVGGRAALSGWQHLSTPGAPCQRLARKPLNPTEMTALCCINVASLLGSRRFNQKYAELNRWEQRGDAVQCVFMCVRVRLRAHIVQVGLGLLLPLSVSLHLSHDFPDSDSPGVSHLGHQLHSQVNCSSKWSAKQCRKKKKKERRGEK